MFQIKFHVFAFLLIFDVDAITLNNGQYEDLYIVIQDSVEENQELLERIQVVFNEASRLMFSATNNQVYFGKIKVVIPKKWSTKTYFRRLPAMSSLETYVNIGNWRISAPHVKSKTYQCGEEGLVMNLQPSFFLQTGKTNYGNHDHVIVHEWGHLRWGLFDEYPTRIGSQIESFYQHEGKWKPVGCSHKVQGRIGGGSNCYTDHTTGCDTANSGKMMQGTCYFCANSDQDVQISLMGYQYIEQMAKFCDKDDDSVPENERHNSIAPNAQNKFCDGKSAWEIMREHDDFKNSHPLIEANTTEFEYIQEREQYRVFVLDVSGSMGDNNRIGILAQAGTYIILERLCIGSFLAIVTFNDQAFRTIDMKQINTQEDKYELIRALPTLAEGSTCIGCGIEEAINIFTEELGSPENGEIILISDGENNQGNLDLSRLRAIDARVKIITIAVSQQADTLLADIAIETGGKYFTYLELETISFAAVFSEAVSGGCSVTELSSQPAMILSEKINSNVIHTTFSIESGLGKNTSVTVLTDVYDDIHLELYGPENYTQNMTVLGNNIAIMKIDGHAKPGDYHLSINTSYGQSMEYLVMASPTDTTNDVIRVVTRLSKSKVDLYSDDFPIILADVTKNTAPVINATVQATVETNGNKSCILDLYDSGTGPDKLKHDGTYSCYILPRCLGPGRVQIKVAAAAKGGEVYLLYSHSGSASIDEDQEDIEETLPDSFQRSVVTEELYIYGYSYDATVDTITPSRITDVRIYNIVTETTLNRQNRNLTLTWTATGNDRNYGQAFSYEMRFSSDITILRHNFELAEILNMTNTTFFPQTCGKTEALKLVVEAEESYDRTMFFAIRAVDDAGNKGPVSNIVSIVVAKGSKVTGYVVTESDYDVYMSSEESSKSRDFKYFIYGGAVTFGLLIFIAILSIVTYKTLKAKQFNATDGNVPYTMTEVVSIRPKQRKRTLEATRI